MLKPKVVFHVCVRFFLLVSFLVVTGIRKFATKNQVSIFVHDVQK